MAQRPLVPFQLIVAKAAEDIHQPRDLVWSLSVWRNELERH